MTKRKTSRRWIAALTGLTLALASSCVGSSGDERKGTSKKPQPHGPVDGDPTNWKPGGNVGECNVDALLPPFSHGAKVKTLLTSLPLSEAELTTLQIEPTALAGMIDSWLEMPEADAVLERFFMTAFQQTSGDNESLFYLLGENASSVGFFSNPRSGNIDEMLNQNFAESIARTATEIVKSGQPFNTLITTDTFMMTTAMLAFIAYQDDDVVDDEEDHNIRTTAGHFPSVTLHVNEADAPPLGEAYDPQSPNFMEFWHPRLAGMDPSCNVGTSVTVDTTQGNVPGEWRLSRRASYYAFSAGVLGRIQSINIHQNSNCISGASNQGRGPELLDRGDFSDWRMVRVVDAAGDTPTLFYDIDTLRALGPGNDIKLLTPRVGFFTTPGFQSTWGTNEDNSHRVTINQTLIVSLNKSFDGVTVTDFTPDNINAEHIDPGSECYGCHQTLDPMRNAFRASFSNFFGQQTDPERVDLEYDFVFGGVQTSGVGVEPLAQTLADHPDFAEGWTHKLCYYANAAECAEGDELDRIAQAFTDSGFDFRVLVRELFSSPLVTGAECISGVDAGTSAIIARRSTFCQQLSHRLGLADLCALRTHFRDASNLQNDVRDAVGSVPDDSFSRSNVPPVVISETGLFARANREAACTIVAQDGYDTAFAGMMLDAALDKMVRDVMGLPDSDPRHDGARQILRDHVDDVVAGGDSENIGLKSAFVLACMAPTSAGVGF